MRRSNPSLVAVALCALGLAPRVDAQDVPIRFLEDALSQPRPAQRRAAADALARRDGVELDAWLTALREWRPSPAHPAGMHVLEVELWNGAELERTELHVYVPAAAFDPETEGGPARRAPLLHAGHGTGGAGGGIARMWRGIADEVGAVVVAPSESGMNDGYHYDLRERVIALEAMRWARANFPIDPDRIYITGISRGGHQTWDLALRHPGLAAAIAPMIGGPRWNPDGQNNLRFLENIVDLPIRDLQGLRDDPGMIFNLRLAFDRLEKLEAPDAKFIEFPELGHSFEMDAVDWVGDFFAKRRDPVPSRVVRMASTKGEGRAFWVEIEEWDSRKVRDRFRPEMSTSLYNRLDDAGRRKWIADKALDRTARLEITHAGDGKFTVASDHVVQFRVLLTEAMLGDADQAIVRWRGRRKKSDVERSAQLLLREFVEHVDPSFLPIAEARFRQ